MDQKQIETPKVSSTKESEIAEVKNDTQRELSDVKLEVKAADPKVAEFSAEFKNTGVPDAMNKFLVENKKDIERQLQVYEGENLPKYIKEKTLSYANQKHALLVYRNKLSAGKGNEEGIMAYFDFTWGPGGPMPPELRVYSAYSKDLEKEKTFVVQKDDKTFMAQGDPRGYPASYIINKEILYK